MARFDGKVAIITGAASGIGRAAAVAFAREGARVVVADINEKGGQETAARIGPAALFAPLDVTREDHWRRVIEVAEDRFGRLDILANVAGIGTSGDFEEATLEDWNRIVAVNMTGPFLGAKHAIAAIKKHGAGGAIVTVASIAAEIGAADIAAYTASKGGVKMLMKCVALHCAERGYNIRVNTINPTFVDSEMLDPIAALYGDRQVMIDSMSKLVPMKRLAKPEDVARSILFLASDDAALITGSAINVDGGQLAGFPAQHSGS